GGQSRPGIAAVGRPAGRARGVLRSVRHRGPARRDARLHGEAPGDLDGSLNRTRRESMERDPFEGGSDVGADLARNLGEEPGSMRDAAPDVLAQIDTSAPVSGHVPAPETTTSAVDSPEHDWSLARALVQPAFRPVGTQGLELETIQRDDLLAHASKSHAQPLADVGPAGIPVVYVIPAAGFDIVVNGDHVLSWGIEPTELQDAAIANLE